MKRLVSWDGSNKQWRLTADTSVIRVILIAGRTSLKSNDSFAFMDTVFYNDHSI